MLVSEPNIPKKFIPMFVLSNNDASSTACLDMPHAFCQTPS